MAYEMKDMTGSLFKNNKTKDNQPDYKGKAKVDQGEYEIAAWITESKAGTKYMSIKFRHPRDGQVYKDKETVYKPGPPEEMEDDIPF